MEIENKLKAMGLELPAAGTPPAGRAGAVTAGYSLEGESNSGRGTGFFLKEKPLNKKRKQVPIFLRKTL